MNELDQILLDHTAETGRTMLTLSACVSEFGDDLAGIPRPTTAEDWDNHLVSLRTYTAQLALTLERLGQTEINFAAHVRNTLTAASEAS